MVAVGLGLAGCNNGAAVPDNATQVADTLSGDAKGVASANSRCAMFSQQEIAALAGEPVEAGANAAGGLGCQWKAADGSGLAIVTVAPAEYHNPTSAAPGFRPLADVGEDGFVAKEGAGWTAGARGSGKAVVVSIEGERTTEANVIALLKQSVGKVAAGAAAN